MSVTKLMVSEDEKFTTFFNESYPGLCRFLECLLGGNRGAAQDLAQESFLQLYRTGLDSFPAGEVKFWLYRVARNLALNELNKRQTRHRLFEKVINVFSLRTASPEEELERLEQKALLGELFKFLPEHQRAALLLREQQEMSYRDIAQVLGVSESKVKIDLFRARNTLRAKWLHAQQTAQQRAPFHDLIKGILP